MEIGRRPAAPVPFFDDVDRGFVVAQLEGRMDAPVDLSVAVGRSSPLALDDPAGAEEARRAEQLAQELASLEPRLRATVTEDGARDAACPG